MWLSIPFENLTFDNPTYFIDLILDWPVFGSTLYLNEFDWLKQLYDYSFFNGKYCCSFRGISLSSSSSILMLFYYIAPLQNDFIVTSQCMQFTFGDKREVILQGAK